jgi:hypothetical protein
MAHYTDKTHFFRDNNDNRMVVISTMLPDGTYQADIIEPACPIAHGYGTTRMEAIVDLREALEDELDDGE